MESKTKMKYCNRCKKKIKILEKGVTWTTFDNGKDIEVIHWHWQCFMDWRNESITNKAEKIYIENMSKILPISQKMIGSMINDAKHKIKVQPIEN